ncbi:MAG: hypothetical protein EA422_10235 [Gemmatimonadales bacterium]|nr:MAG: hypothetical protein EA422_10235 [Gemmatimonadales bacterium]
MLLGVVAVPGAVAAQAPSDILERALAAHEARLSGVDDLTIRQEVLGFPSVVFMEKEMVDGRPVLRSRSVDAAGIPGGMDPGDVTGELWSDPAGLFGDALERWTLDGSGSVEGRATWQMSLTDFEGLTWDATLPGDDTPFHPRSIRLELEQDRHIPLHMWLEGEVVDGGERRPVAVEARFSDYREVNGYLHPFLSVLEVDLAQAGLSADEVAQARAGLDELRRQLEVMPEAQRAMMEQMMGDQIRMLEGALSGERIQIELKVLDLQVNAGPPGEMR